MNKPYENSRLWQSAFTDKNDGHAQTLAVQYSAAWDKACSIAARIQTDALGLTLHDERHFTALWEAADLLIPPELSLSPVETFVFGVAVLVHDAAHTTLAYEGGLKALSETPEWADNLVARLGEDELDKIPLDLENLPENLKRAVLFDTVRALHAKQAHKILTVPFQHPAFDTDMYLIDDPSIRNHMGDVIGNIAASHHWDLSKVAQLAKSQNVAAPYHAYGSIRPMLLAALMRTADAIQIDNSRAPDFVFALMKPSGLSQSHWSAQNKLATGVDSSDPNALLINSTAPFLETDAPAWWIAYDLANIADRELRNTDALLRDYGQPRLSLLGVKDAADPVRFAQHVKTEGWYPVSAEVKVGDTASLIEVFGGKSLYGNDFTVPLRELIQNAVDAVRARRILDDGFEGKITVGLVEGQNSAGQDGYWLRVIDNGIGMSSAILTGPFITFGESGWSSSALRKDRPGFVGRRFNHIGKFGIGFFSAFMIGEEIKVTSRPFDAAASDAKLLHFGSSLTLRPLVKKAERSTVNTSTSVEVFINADVKKRMMHWRDEATIYAVGQPAKKRPAKDFSMVELIGMICPAIDVDIEAFDGDSGTRASVNGDWMSCDGVDWLSRINGIEPDELPQAIAKNVDLMTLIGPLEHPIGRACLNPTGQEFGRYTVGGLAGKKPQGVTSAPNFVGSIERKPAGPRRDPGDKLGVALVAKWATEQAKLWAQADISPKEKNFIAANACFFGGDPLPLANAQIDGEWRSIAEIYDLLLEVDVIRAPIQQTHHNSENWSVMESVNLPSGYLYHPEDVEVELRNVMLAGASKDLGLYWSIPSEGAPKPYSLFGTLGRFALTQGKILEFGGENVDYGFYKGPTISREFRTHGDRIVLPTLELRILDQMT